MGFSCSVRQDAGQVVIAVSGDVDLAAHPLFLAEIARSWDGSTDLVVDLSQVTFLDSMGLRVLVQTRQHAEDSGRAFALLAPSRPVLRVFDLAGVTGIFTILDAVPDAEPDPDPA